jgi:hypothetical protein
MSETKTRYVVRADYGEEIKYCFYGPGDCPDITWEIFLDSWTNSQDKEYREQYSEYLKRTGYQIAKLRFEEVEE